MMAIDWVRRTAEYAVGAVLVLAHLAATGRVTPQLDPRPRRAAGERPVSPASG